MEARAGNHLVTLRGNLKEVVRGEHYGDRSGMPSMMPEREPFPLDHDTSGMRVDVALLDRSLDKGIYA
jgi:hypothetical protein